jgi:hypothetical protein
MYQLTVFINAGDFWHYFNRSARAPSSKDKKQK